MPCPGPAGRAHGGRSQPPGGVRNGTADSRETRLQAIGLSGSFNQQTNDQIPGLWRAFRERHGEIESALEGHYFGLCIGVEDDSFTYMAAVEARDLDKVPEGLCGLEVAAQTYAVFTVPLAGKEPIGREIGRANRFIWNTWLPQSGYVFARAPDFEYYDERFDPKTLCGEIDLYVPIQKRDGRPALARVVGLALAQRSDDIGLGRQEGRTGLEIRVRLHAAPAAELEGAPLLDKVAARPGRRAWRCSRRCPPRSRPAGHRPRAPRCRRRGHRRRGCGRRQ